MAWGTSSNSNPWGGTPTKKSGGGGVLGGIEHFVGNLAGDVRTSVVGLPEGLLQTAEHPIGSLEKMGSATWHDWSPLFSGHVGQFAHNFYDHPLAPLLDVATVFSGGAALGGRLASVLDKAGVDNALVQSMKMGSERLAIADPKAVEGEPARMTQYAHTPASPLQRGIYKAWFNQAGKYADHLPKWFTPQGKFERSHLVSSVDRHTAMIRSNQAVVGLHHQIEDTAAASKPVFQVGPGGAADTTRIEAHNAQLAAISWGGKTLAENPKLATPLVLNHIYDGAMMHGVHFEDRARYGNNHLVTDSQGLPKYKATPKGWTYLKMKDQKLMDSFQHHPDVSIEDRLQSLGSTMTTDNPRLAARDASGKAILVQTRNLRDLGIEGSNSARFMKWWYKYPTQVWKMALVGLSPKMVVDNTVGNWTMYAMRQSGHHAVRGIFDAIKQTHNLKTAKTSLASASDQVLNPHWMERHFKNELGDQSFMGSTLKKALTPEENAKFLSGQSLAEPNRALRGGLYPLVHKIADQPVRRGAINAFMRGSPEVKTLMNKGMSFNDAADKALRTKTGLADRAVAHSRSVAGDYHTLSAREQAFKDLVPFYLWDRHIVRHFSNVLYNNPGRVAMLQKLSHLGVLNTQGAMGSIPDFMLGDIPIGKKGNGRFEALSTQGLNPYSTVADLADAFSAATGGKQKAPAGEALGGDLNPVLTGLFEAMTGHRIGTDSVVPSHGGVLPTAAVNLLESFPQAKLIQSGLNNPGGFSDAPGHTASGRTKQPKLYADSLKELISNMLGGPIKDISPQNAQNLFNKQEGIKKKKLGGWG